MTAPRKMAVVVCIYYQLVAVIECIYYQLVAVVVCISYQSMTVVVAQLSADGPVSMFFYLLLIRKHNSLIKPGELQFHTGSLLQRTR